MSSYEFAEPKSDAIQMIPTYSHTSQTPDDTNICWQGAGASPNSANPMTNIVFRCEDGVAKDGTVDAYAECAQLKLGPGAIRVLDTR